MRTKEAIEFIGSAKMLSKFLDITHTSIYAWGEYPPRAKQFELEVRTGGALKVEPELLEVPGQESIPRYV